MTIAIVAEQTYEEIPLHLLRESKTNPRRSFDEAALAELSASIAEVGVQQALLVRPDFDSVGMASGEYEIVVGARRFRASARAGKATAPCIIREISDDEVREIQIVENLQRADVDPLEEAEAFEEMLTRVGSIPEVARKLGKEQSYVAKLLRLTSLSLASRDALRARLITIDHALLLARVAQAEQDEALKFTLDRNAGSKTKIEKVIEERIAQRKKEEADQDKGSGFRRYTWEPESVVRLKAWIEAESGILLSRAPWSLTDEDSLLPDVGPCSECPSNTRANSPLFGDLQMGEATCTNGACFQRKTDRFVQIERRKAGHDPDPRAKVTIPSLSWKISSVKPGIVFYGPITDKGPRPSMANPEKVLKYGQWIDAKPGSCTNVRSGITVDWSDAGDRGYMGGSKKLRKPGELVHVCIAVDCKAHPKAWEKAQAKPQQERHDPAAEKRAQEERAHLEKVERAIRSVITFAILEKMDSAKAVHAVTDRQRGAEDWRKRLLEHMPNLDAHTLEALTLFCCEFSWHIQPNGYWLTQPGGVAKDRKETWDLAKRFGVDANQVTAKYFHDQGSIAPASDRLYPKGVPWPKGFQPTAAKKSAAKKTAAKKSVAKKVSAPAKKAVKVKPRKLSAARKKAIADAMKKRWSATKAVATKAAKKGAA